MPGRTTLENNTSGFPTESILENGLQGLVGKVLDLTNQLTLFSQVDSVGRIELPAVKTPLKGPELLSGWADRFYFFILERSLTFAPDLEFVGFTFSV